MNIPPLLHRHRSLRWLLPASFLGLAGLLAAGVFSAQATPEQLPPVTPAALLAAMQITPVSGFSGTVVSQVSLGLPELPAVGASEDGASMAALLTGSHTLRVWYGGPDRQRVALMGATEETDVFRTGTDMWEWSSADHVALHAVLPARAEPAPGLVVPTSPASLDPAELATRAIAAIDPSTSVTIGDNLQVANRSAYELVLRPRASTTRIESVRIAVDGRTKVPLAVRVYARGDTQPAVDVAFTSIRFSAPPDTYFSFAPPPGATVREITPPPALLGGAAPPADRSGKQVAGRPPISVRGTGWATVLGLRLTPAKAQAAMRAVGPGVTPVAGPWGRGRLLETTLLSVLVTNDGRVFAGAVDPSELYAAATAN